MTDPTSLITICKLYNLKNIASSIIEQYEPLPVLTAIIAKCKVHFQEEEEGDCLDDGSWWFLIVLIRTRVDIPMTALIGSSSRRGHLRYLLSLLTFISKNYKRGLKYQLCGLEGGAAGRRLSWGGHMNIRCERLRSPDRSPEAFQVMYWLLGMQKCGKF